jgi:AhpD family alkylhydroperoxidase
LQGTLSRVLDAKTRHSIALVVSQASGCSYCLAMHTYGATEFGGMSGDDVELGRVGSSVDPKRAVAARFALRVVDTRGRVSDAHLAGVRGAGYTDPQILAIVAVAVQFLLTNFINNVNQTDLDIPPPPSRQWWPSEPAPRAEGSTRVVPVRQASLIVISNQPFVRCVWCARVSQGRKIRWQR